CAQLVLARGPDQDQFRQGAHHEVRRPDAAVPVLSGDGVLGCRRASADARACNRAISAQGDKTLKRIHFLVALVGLMLISAAANAQGNDFRVGFVSTERLFREAAPAVRALKKLEKEFQPRDQELQKMVKQAKDLQTQLEKEAVTMSESDRRAKEADLGRMNRDLQRMQREFRED